LSGRCCNRRDAQGAKPAAVDAGDSIGDGGTDACKLRYDVDPEGFERIDTDYDGDTGKPDDDS
jgi:hypothetical protein